MQTLPPELILLLGLEHLDPLTVACLAQTCRNFCHTLPHHGFKCSVFDYGDTPIRDYRIRRNLLHAMFYEASTSIRNQVARGADIMMPERLSCITTLDIQVQYG